VAAFFRNSLETAATTIFSNLATSLGRKLKQEDGAASSEDSGDGDAPHAPPRPAARPHAAYRSFAVARAPAGQPVPEAGPGQLPPLPEPLGAPVGRQAAARPQVPQPRPRLRKAERPHAGQPASSCPVQLRHACQARAARLSRGLRQVMSGLSGHASGMQQCLSW